MEERNGADANHPLRIGALSVLLAREIGLPPDEVEAIELGAALHDVGTLALPDEILRDAASPGAGRSIAYEAHTTLGYRLLKGCESEPIRTAAIIALAHHEWYDGRGYPTGLSGDHIRIAARIVATADRLDTLRLEIPQADWAEVWARFAGDRASRLDPALVDALMTVRDQAEHVYQRLPCDAIRGA